MASARVDIEALISRADAAYPTLDKSKRVDFAGVTAMAGLTILAQHLDELEERLDRIYPPTGPGAPDVESQVAELHRRVEALTAQVSRGPVGPG